MSINKFSEKSLLSLGDYYVYGLVDPRNNSIFYIGKGSGNRIFAHENEIITNANKDKLKLETISEIKKCGKEVGKVIIHSNLTEEEAFASEASLINVFNYFNETKLTNSVNGHHSEGCLTVDQYERVHGAELLEEKDIKHSILIIKINRFYNPKMNDKEIYDTVRGLWRVSKDRVKKIDYVFGVYNSLIVGVYKPTKWFVAKDAQDRLPREEDLDAVGNRLFFIDESFENGIEPDDNQKFYLWKSINNLKKNQKTQNPISYLEPKCK